MESTHRPGRSSGFPAPPAAFPFRFFETVATNDRQGSLSMGCSCCDRLKPLQCAVGRQAKRNTELGSIAQSEGRVTAAGPLPTRTGFPIKLVHLDRFQIRNGAGSVKGNRCCRARSAVSVRFRAIAFSRVCGAACRRCARARVHAGEARCRGRFFRFGGCKSIQPARPENRIRGIR